jgi:sec-independent protein translocase protein TatA
MNDNVVELFNLPGGMEWIVLLVLGLILFGGRLPEVARSIGKSIVEFKKGMRDVKEELDDATRDQPRSRLENKSDRTPAGPGARSLDRQDSGDNA